MTDKELLELAAKAAGVVVLGYYDCGSIKSRIHSNVKWNPLTDDGDALRLAVKLDMQVTVDIGGGEVWVMHELFHSMIFENLEDANEYAATRRAIVRAAAAIGERL